MSARSDTQAARAHAFAFLRLLTGFVFLWAFLDKTFGLGYATPSGKGWIYDGSPTMGFLSSVAAGPMESTFHSWAGAASVNWLFMLGLFGIGVALNAGAALRFAAVAGTLMMAFMWLAEWPPAQDLSEGSPSMSSNPFVDYHLIYAVALIALAAVCAGDTLGLGRLVGGSAAPNTGQGRSVPRKDLRPLPGASSEDQARIRTPQFRRLTS